VLAFVPKEERLDTVSALVKHTKPGGVIVIVSHPEKEDQKWVAALMKGCEGASGLTIAMDDERLPYQMEFDGKMHDVSDVIPARMCCLADGVLMQGA